MEIYDIELEDDDRLAKPRWLLLFVANFVLYAAVVMLLRLWLSQEDTLLRHQHHSWGEIGELTVLGILTNLGMTVYGSSKKFRLSVTQSWQKYQIIVEEDQIRTRKFNSLNRLLSKAVQRDKVRTVVEKEKGLLISSRDRVGTFLYGGIWIPKRLPDYEYLKRLVLSWKI